MHRTPMALSQAEEQILSVARTIPGGQYVTSINLTTANQGASFSGVLIDVQRDREEDAADAVRAILRLVEMILTTYEVEAGSVH